MAAKKKTADKVNAAQELRALSIEELRTALADKQQEVLSLRFKHATAQLEKTSELKSAKRQVARIQTIMQEKV